MSLPSPCPAPWTAGWPCTSATAACPCPRSWPKRSAWPPTGSPPPPIWLTGPPRWPRWPANTDIPADLQPGGIVRRPGTARALEAIAAHAPGRLLRGRVRPSPARARSRGVLAPPTSTPPSPAAVEPVRASAFGCDLWTVPPPSQGYLTLGRGLDRRRPSPGGRRPSPGTAADALPPGGRDADADGLPLGPPGAADADALPLGPPGAAADGRWAHLLVEAASAAAYDRHRVLHEGAEGRVLVHPARLAPRRAAINPDRAANLAPPAAPGATGRTGGSVAPPPATPGDPDGDVAAPGDTTYLCAVDADRTGVSSHQLQRQRLRRPSGGRCPPASSSTTGGNRLQPRAGPSRPLRPRPAALPTPWPRPWSPGPTVPCAWCWAPWAATPSPRSCFSSCTAS